MAAFDIKVDLAKLFPEKSPKELAEMIRANEERDHEMRIKWQDQADELMAAGWRFEISPTGGDIWQWQWRRPPRRARSKGRLFLSTQQALNALRREKSGKS